MSDDPLPDVTEEFARTLAPEGDEAIEAMDERADREGFPTVGPAVGGWLRLLARAVDADRVFEFGSGYGYSAYWIAPALPRDGEIVLTEIDGDELDDARENLAAGGYADQARFEHGDAIETVDDYEGPFDLVLIDNEKDRYVEAFEAVRDKIAPGGIVAADNAIEAGPLDFDDVRGLVVGEDVEANAMSAGIAEYLQTVRDDPDFETSVLPLGEGMAVSIRV